MRGEYRLKARKQHCSRVKISFQLSVSFLFVDMRQVEFSPYAAPVQQGTLGDNRTWVATAPALRCSVCLSKKGSLQI